MFVLGKIREFEIIPFQVLFEHFLRRLRRQNHCGLIEPLNLVEYFLIDYLYMTNHYLIDIY